MRAVPRPLFILAMDHRAVMRSLFEVEGETEAAQTARFVRAKELAYEALRRCVASGRLDTASAGVLVDGDYGHTVAEAVVADGRYLIMPVEISRTQTFTSGTPEFQLDGGEDGFGALLERHPIDMVKALIVHNAGLPDDQRARHVERARLVGDWCRDHDVAYMVEILVPPVGDQGVDGVEAYKQQHHADLVHAAIAEFQAGGVEPDVWKIEPLATPADYARVSGLARSGGRDGVDLVLLGGGADIERAAGYVSEIHDAEGFSGFAIGRSVWQAPFTALFDGSATEEETIDVIASNLDLLVSRFVSAAPAAEPIA